MSTFNTSTRKEDLSMKLRTQNMKYTRTQTKKLEEDSRKMEDRLNELKTAMSREKEERERQGGGFWDRGQMQTGSLTNYATEVLKSKPQVAPREGKKKKIKVLQDDPLDIPQRSSQPGTMKYIAQRKITSGPSPREKQKGPKCGQCEERSATLSCVQCSEMYCAGCFAAFHIRGALKKHRSIPISAAGPRVCMSPRPSVDLQSPRGSQASGSVGLYELPPANGSEAAGPPSTQSTPRNTGSSLLRGDYDESQSAASFQQALKAWRQGDSTSPQDVTPAGTPKPVASPVRSPVVSVDSSTGTVEQVKVPEIKFKASLTYAEKLMLKKHRRTELATPRLDDQPDSLHHSETNSRISSRREKNSQSYFEQDGDDEDRVDFHSLFEAVAFSERSSPDKSVPEILHLRPIPGDAPILNSSSTYLVNEVSPFESWETEQKNKTPLNSSTFVANQSEKERHAPVHTSSNQRKLDPVTELFRNPSPSLEAAMEDKENNEMDNMMNRNTNVSRIKKSRRPSPTDMNEVTDDVNTTNNHSGRQSPAVAVSKSRPKSVRAKSAKSRPASRAQSRAQSRAASRMSNDEGVLTKAPSEALSQIARMSQKEEYVYQSPMEGFFLVGVDGDKSSGPESSQIQSRPKSRAQALKSARGERETIKVSNRLYQMAPRSWRPDSSLGDTIPLSDVQVPELEPEMTLSYSYSGQMSGRATEWRPTSSQSGIVMPGDDLGLGLHDDMTQKWLDSQISANQTKSNTTTSSGEFSAQTPHSVTPIRKSASRRRNNAATPVIHSEEFQNASETPTPMFDSVRDRGDNSTPKPRSSHGSKSVSRPSSSFSSQDPSQANGAPRQGKPAVPDVLSSSRSQTRISSSKGGNRIGVELLPSRSGVMTSSHPSSKSQRHNDGTSSSRHISEDSFVKSSGRGSRSREGSHLSSKNSDGGGLVRHHSDVDQTQRPASSTLSSQISSQRTRQEDRKPRPSSSTGGTEGNGNLKNMSCSVDTEITTDTVVADMLADRVQSDVWMMGQENLDTEESNRPPSQSGRRSKAPKSKRPDSGHWETEVIPFSRESVESRQSVVSARESPMHDNRKKRPVSSRPSSMMSGRDSRAVVMEGDDLSFYDQLGQEVERDQDDVDALHKLEWELASDTGRLTADGNISRLSVLEHDEGRRSGSSSSRSSSRSLRMSVEKDYDISAKLQEDDCLAQKDLDDFNLRRSTTLDEDDVKALA